MACLPAQRSGASASRQTSYRSGRTIQQTPVSERSLPVGLAVRAVGLAGAVKSPPAFPVYFGTNSTQ
ncbi:MAG: hypothetical protein KDD27_07940 [Saprospiraceae bacterium]|nr:hypothetical protein [Saprospiraceae bacterium]